MSQVDLLMMLSITLFVLLILTVCYFLVDREDSRDRNKALALTIALTMNGRIDYADREWLNDWLRDNGTN